MYTFRAYINKYVFRKILSKIEKAVKTFSILDKKFSKNSILLYTFRACISKILIQIKLVVVLDMEQRDDITKLVHVGLHSFV